MVHSHLAPVWFYGFDVGFELSFAVISLLVSLFAFKIYRRTSQRLVFMFGISFMLISISYFIQSVLNFLIVSSLNDNLSSLLRVISVAGLEYLGIMTHIIFMTTGLSILYYATVRVQGRGLLWFLIIISLSAVLFSMNTLFMFYLISSIYLIFISWNSLLNYLKKKQAKTLLVTLAFIFLLFSTFHFLISVNHQLFYAIGHLFEFFAYALILINFYLVQRQ